jgi:hypothetical protein
MNENKIPNKFLEKKFKKMSKRNTEIETGVTDIPQTT